METEKKEVETRVIKSAEQTDLKVEEKPKEVGKKEFEQTRIGTTAVILIPYEENGKEYIFKVQPLNIDQQCYFATKYPSGDENDIDKMQEKLLEVKKVLLEQITETPDGFDVTAEYISALKTPILLKLISALSGGFEEDFTKQ